MVKTCRLVLLFYLRNMDCFPRYLSISIFQTHTHAHTSRTHMHTAHTHKHTESSYQVLVATCLHFNLTLYNFFTHLSYFLCLFSSCFLSSDVLLHFSEALDLFLLHSYILLHSLFCPFYL